MKRSPLWRRRRSLLHRGAAPRGRRKKALESLRYASFHDPLTDLYNRAFFMEELHRLDVEAAPLSIIFADLDGLKLVNDVWAQKG